MPRFADEHEAKEFLIRLIVSEADRERINLSELERRMMAFSEDEWPASDLQETALLFEGQFDSGEYERKIRALAKKLTMRLAADDAEAFKAWTHALKKLKKGDYYLLLLAKTDSKLRRPPYDLLRLCVAAVAIVVGLGVLVLVLEHVIGLRTREESAFVLWVIASSGVSVFLLLTLLVGREKANDLISFLIAKVLGDPTPKR